MTRSAETGGRILLSVGAGIFAATIAVRGALSLLPDFLRYDRYGDTRDVIVVAMYLFGLGVFGVTIKVIDNSLAGGGSDRSNGGDNPI